MASEEIDPRRHKFWLSVEFLKVYVQKNIKATILFLHFTKAFDSIHRGKMEQILRAYGLPKKTVAAIMILYRNAKVKVCSFMIRVDISVYREEQSKWQQYWLLKISTLLIEMS